MLLGKGVIGPAPPNAHLHRVVLVEGRPDHLAQSGKAYRLCTNFSAINARTCPDGFPAPELNDCLRQLHGSTGFSSLDIKAGYHNIPVSPESIPYCNFVA